MSIWNLLAEMRLDLQVTVKSYPCIAADRLEMTSSRKRETLQKETSPVI